MSERAFVSLVSFSTLLPIITGAFGFKKMPKYFKLFVALLCAKFILEIPAVIKNLKLFAVNEKIASANISILFFINIILFIWMYGYSPVSAKLKPNVLPYYYLIIFYVLSLLLLAFFPAVFFKYLMKLNYLVFALFSILNSIFSIDILSNESTNLNHKFLQSPLVIFHIAILFSSIMYLFQYILVKFGFKYNSNKGTFYTIIEGTQILTNIIFTYGFICLHKKKTYYSLYA